MPLYRIDSAQVRDSQTGELNPALVGQPVQVVFQDTDQPAPIFDYGSGDPIPESKLAVTTAFTLPRFNLQVDDPTGVFLDWLASDGTRGELDFSRAVRQAAVEARDAALDAANASAESAQAAVEAASQATAPTAEVVDQVLTDPQTAAAQILAGKVGKDEADGRYAVRLVWDGTEYPPRVPGATNIFVGPVDPGLEMDPDTDVWANPDVTTLGSVVAAMQDPSSALFAATSTAAAGAGVALHFTDAAGSGVVRADVASDSMRAWVLPDGVAGYLYGSATVPVGWTNVAIEFYWMHNVAGGTGDVRWAMNGWPYRDAATFPTATQITNSVAAAANGVIKRTRFSAGVAVTPGGAIGVRLGRLGQVAADTFAGNVFLLAARLVRVA